MLLRRRSPLAASIPLRVLGLALGTGLAAQACGGGSPSDSTSSGIGGGGGGVACGIGTLALANVGKGACSKNSLGGTAFETSCTGNGGSPEYWCADFAKWVWASSGADVGGLTAAAASFYSYGMTHGTLSSTPSVGDAVVFHPKSSSTVHHVAIVTQVNSDGTIETVSGDWGGMSGSEAHFASTSHATLNSPAYPGTVGTSPSIMAMTLVSFVHPAGLGACVGADGGGSGGSGGGGGTSGSGGASEGGAGGDDGGSGESGSGSGSGGGGGSGSGSGSGGSSGSGGGGGGGSKDGGGAKGGGGSSEGGYAFIERAHRDRRFTIEVAQEDVSETVPFAWHDAPGLAPPADLWVEAGGRRVLQLSAVRDSPFVRAGLDVVPLVADARYRLVFAQGPDAIDVSVVDASDHVVLRTRTATDLPVADIVLPSSFWRASIVSDLR